MSREYYEQWDREDLDSWQGKDCPIEDVATPPCEKLTRRACDCGNCMECLGMSWYDFM